MKFLLKQLVITALALVFTAPAHADLTKGTKSYQARPEAPAAQTPAQIDDKKPAAMAADISNIAPAAGDQADTAKAADEGKSFKDQIRLPRKN